MNIHHKLQMRNRIARGGKTGKVSKVLNLAPRLCANLDRGLWTVVTADRRIPVKGNSQRPLS